MGQTTSSPPTQPSSTQHKKYEFRANPKFISRNTELLCSGANHCGELGLANEQEKFKTTFVHCDTPPKLKFVVGGGAFSFIVTDDNRIFSTGLNDYGVLGIDDDVEEIHEFRQLKVPSGNISCISSGYFHCCMIIDNTLYGVGDTSNGRLGIPSSTAIKKFTKIADDIQRVSCGGLHTMVLSNGVVHGCGSNAFGQISLDPEYTSIDALELTKVYIPTEEKIQKIACGLYHTLVLTERGDLYACGHNVFGQCSLRVQNTKLFTRVHFTVPIMSIYAGNYHTAVITRDNDLFMSGNNCSGQLGLNDLNDRPELVHVGLKAIDVCITLAQHTMINTIDRGLYVSGWNSHAPLGLGHINNVQQFTYTGVKNVLAMGCGSGHSLVVVENGFEYAITGMKHQTRLCDVSVNFS
jgi:alpha-tubulin suppressor-like RCC1 family protein